MTAELDADIAKNYGRVAGEEWAAGGNADLHSSSSEIVHKGRYTGA